MCADSAGFPRSKHWVRTARARRAKLSGGSDFAAAASYNDPQQKRGGYDMRSFAPSLVAVLALTATMSATAPAAAQQPAPATKVTPLLKQLLADVPGREVMMITLDIPPGGGSAPHRHPGHHVFGYVLEGSYKIKLDQGEEKILTKGQTFYEAPGQLHAVSANASATEPAKVLAVIVAESGKPVTVPEKQ
jgi:quercetin dioxygenase-like cupin family protein